MEEPLGLLVAALGVLAAAVSAVAAAGAWRAASASNRTSKVLARIEIDRRHQELVPQFELDADELTNGQIRLRVNLAGPNGLDRLDSVVLSVRDDSVDHRPGIAGGPTEADIAKTVWGPYRFVAGVDGADSGGRKVAPFALELASSREFLLESTVPPMWTDQTWWTAQYAGGSLRLTLRCTRGDEPDWIVPLTIRPYPRAQIF